MDETKSNEEKGNKFFETETKNLSPSTTSDRELQYRVDAQGRMINIILGGIVLALFLIGIDLYSDRSSYDFRYETTVDLHERITELNKEISELKILIIQMESNRTQVIPALPNPS